MVKSAIQVVVRSRPTADFAHDAIKLDTQAGTVSIHMDRNSGGAAAGLNNLQQDWTFRVNRVMPNASQEDMFEACGRDMVMSTLAGYNGTLMAYGQTGAGKSFTMGNGTYDYKYRGISPRAITLLFRAIASKPETEINVRVSYLEIYNETLRDLLSTSTRDLSIREDGNGNVSVKGLHLAYVSNEEEALNMLFEGESNRAVAEHMHNTASSRSHTIFTMHLESRSRVESSEKVIVSKLHLVDLAGSERVAKTDSRGQTLQEALYINRSLSFLEQVVIALSTKHRDHIPFRSSKLTHVLRDSLGGNSITRMIANIWPESRHLEETISTLKFATRMMRLTNDAAINIDLDPTLLLKKYESQIALLKQELAMHDMIANRGPVSYDEFTPEQQAELRHQVDLYLANEIPRFDVVNLQQVHELFRQFRIAYNALARGAAPVVASTPQASVTPDAAAATKQQQPPASVTSTKTGTTPPPGVTKGAATPPSGSTPAPNPATGPVGDLVETTGFSVGGVAPADSRPNIEDDAEAVLSRASSPDRQSFLQTPAPADPVPISAGVQVAIDDERLLQEWKAGDGATCNNEYVELVQKSHDIRQQIKAAGAEVNDAKRAIDALSDTLAMMRANRQAANRIAGIPDNTEIIDEEEYALIRDLKQRKVDYGKSYDRWSALRNQAALLKENVHQVKQRLANQFLQWCEVQRRGVDSVDVLDDGEQFEKIETERILSTDPDSLSYYNARKNLLRHAHKKRSKRSGMVVPR
ncbi:unnamed protein product (mitochondrion) [Plasmodiophora brassicae]|uniref:Kinesin-like protein n=1 Tax=Plasmodiophora brassicae TaxID=37360 RepID=A0A0G4J8E4_PLABS|nr:hypothetical protein PBRA_003389 [Plasmodiophora brassicae]SPQ99740.1 unnamed protein product [Plasmodiophora brassicae]